METQVFIAAFLIGVAGSLHCIGMCGPLAMALPVRDSSLVGKIAGRFLYNFGRTFTYALMGLVSGLIGKVFYLAGYQQLLSVLLGLMIVTAVVYPSLVKGKVNFMRLGAVNSVKRGLSRIFNNGSYPSLFLTGILNGFLPCGLVYMALAGSMSTGGILSGSIFMAAFGLGTLPVMMAVSLGGAFAGEALKSRLRKGVPAMMLVMGLVLILRGLNLGIPYVSPAAGIEGQEIHSCH